MTALGQRRSGLARRARLTARRLVRSAWFWTLLVAAALAIPAALVLAPAALHFDDIRRYGDRAPHSTAFMDARQAAGARLDHRWVAYERIAPALKHAVVVAEDARFVDHAGIDWQAVERALRRNLRADGIVRGASTISQQLAKNLFLSERRTYLRKAREAALALLIERTLDKRRILELYLNLIEWGDGVFGAEAAARHYYGVSASQLSRWQAAMLAARIPRPRYYDRAGPTGYLHQRAAQIAEWMPHARTP